MASLAYSPHCHDSEFVIININKLYPCFMAINLVPSLFIIICTFCFLTQANVACMSKITPAYQPIHKGSRNYNFYKFDFY